MNPQLPDPHQIDISRHFENVLGDSEFDNTLRDIAAWWVVAFLLYRGEGWAPFELAALEAFYFERNNHQFLLYALNWQGKYLKQLPDGQWQVTPAFILACYRCSPAQPVGSA